MDNLLISQSDQLWNKRSHSWKANIAISWFRAKCSRVNWAANLRLKPKSLAILGDRSIHVDLRKCNLIY